MSADIAVEAEIGTLEHYRIELAGYCYRMLGSTFDADDAVQETLVRAWRGWESFEGRSAVRSWLYRIATNVCLDMLRSRQRRALPMDLSSPVPASTPIGAPLPESVWVEPIPDGAVVPVTADPAERAVLRDSIRLAFVSALQKLPPRQRAVLILRDVLCWQATEVAELLDTTVASVNSALQRARATLAASASASPAAAPADALGERERELLAKYVDAFERYDIDTLVTLLHEDGSISMPPLELWLRGREDLYGWYVGTGAGCKGSRLVPTIANGYPAFGHYKPDYDGNGHVPWCVQVVEIVGDRIGHVHHFLDTALFPRFGLPLSLPV